VNAALKIKILHRVAPDLARIEAALRENLGAHLAIVSDVAGHILFSGGKRLRPLLMVLSARLCGYAGGRDVFFSTLFEYLHAATLIHDDLVDGADLRRGKSAAHTLWGGPISVLVGDFLLARSLSIASVTENIHIIKVVAGITENMSQGEIHQINQKQNLNLTEAEYQEIIRRKTAVLIQGACQVGGLISGADDKTLTALSDFGFNLGLAFQMADDLLDYTADTSDLGKTVGADLREGKLTLPVIHALSQAAPKDRMRMETIIKDKNFSARDFKAFIGLLETYGGIAYTWEKARERIETARQSLSIFRDSDTKKTLLDIAEYALIRKQ
jgi:octaprenyl-diphosphate synthase